ncbi:MAG TPA: Maf family protein [Xanthobacteraceae bacterium]|jgi:septum formation protein|nr:Maf family protein [Xanthobacteraceae bacterium]
MSLWTGEPLVLASKSASRRTLLEAAGIPLVLDPAEVDERAIEQSKAAQAGAKEVALLLAREKALATAARHPGRLVLGADQTLALDERRFSKPRSLEAARDQLAFMAGKTHELHSGAAVAKDGKIIFEAVTTARLTMWALTPAFIDAYLAAAGDRVLTSVGAYQLEGFGIHLFEKIEGDHFTILGMPLLALLAYFRADGMIAS